VYISRMLQEQGNHR